MKRKNTKKIRIFVILIESCCFMYIMHNILHIMHLYFIIKNIWYNSTDLGYCRVIINVSNIWLCAMRQLDVRNICNDPVHGLYHVHILFHTLNN
jgi:hypothetical protein